jgi:hypothetical protein
MGISSSLIGEAGLTEGAGGGPALPTLSLSESIMIDWILPEADLD